MEQMVVCHRSTQQDLTSVRASFAGSQPMVSSAIEKCRLIAIEKCRSVAASEAL
jgi:hypothetical protein